MKIFERCASTLAMTATLGPANVASLLIAGCLSSLVFGYRLLSQGYYRCFLSSK